MEIGQSNNHLVLSVLLWTLYWMMQCFAFQSFKNCAAICRGSWMGEGRNETEDGPKVWGPDSSARESPWTCQEGSEVTQQDPTADTQWSAWLLNSALQRALLWARTRWKITARRSSWTKRPLDLRACSRQRDSASPRAVCCGPQHWKQLAPARFCLLQAWAPGSAQSTSGASDHTLVLTATAVLDSLPKAKLKASYTGQLQDQM